MVRVKAQQGEVVVALLGPFVHAPLDIGGAADFQEDRVRVSSLWEDGARAALLGRTWVGGRGREQRGDSVLRRLRAGAGR